MTDENGHLIYDEFCFLLSCRDDEVNQKVFEVFANMRHMSLKEYQSFLIEEQRSLLKSVLTGTEEEQRSWFTELEPSQLKYILLAILRDQLNLYMDARLPGSGLKHLSELTQGIILEEQLNWLNPFLDILRPNMLGALVRDIDRFIIDGNHEAGKRLSKIQYSRGKIFDPRRWETLRDYVKQRRDDEKGRDVWWNEEIVMQSLALVLLSPEVYDLPITEVYKVTRNELRREIEKDLTGGYTSDGKEFQNITPVDKPENEIDEQDEISLFDPVDNLINLNLLSLEDLIDLRKELGKLTSDEYKIIMQSSYGDSLNLSEQLKKSASTIRVIRSRLLKKLKLGLNSM